MNNNQSNEANLKRRQDLLLRASRINSQNKDLRPNWEFQQDLLREEEAFRLRQEERRLGNVRRSNIYIWVINSIYWVGGMLEILLGLRFTLRFFGANPQNGFARVVDNLSAPFIAPFSNLFISSASDGGANIFDANILIAIIVYALLSYLVVSLVRFIFYNTV